jgi:GNAT superfamily N-acetyltransferase
MEYQAEFIKDILHEIKPLLEDHWEEVAWYKDEIKLNPSYDKYIQMQEQNALLCMTVRDDEGTLIGYNINFLQYHPHYSDHVYAINDIIFLLPEYRHGNIAFKLLEATEQVLIHLGVSVVTVHMKPAHPFKTLAEASGFKQQEYVYSKFIED